ncbi:excisionase family DNA-binding protein [Arthrobacter sp. KK5.5]|uniref:excisionase family DNA-binding protein n=1 Tax=Arthrobacter sp. KK5.5 TaxID=3373084 RepID=UPI003EE6702F
MVDPQRFENAQNLPVSEGALATRVSKMNVYRLLRAGELPAVRFGRTYRVPEEVMHSYFVHARSAVGLALDLVLLTDTRTAQPASQSGQEGGFQDREISRPVTPPLRIDDPVSCQVPSEDAVFPQDPPGDGSQALSATYAWKMVNIGGRFREDGGACPVGHSALGDDHMLGDSAQCDPLIDPNVIRELREDLHIPDAADRFVYDFAAMWPARFERLLRSAERQNRESLHDAVLSLKVTSTMVGAVRLRRLTENFEENINRSWPVSMVKPLASIHFCGDLTVRELRRIHRTGT